MIRPRALVVDDEPDLCELLSITLGSHADRIRYLWWT